MTIPEMMPMVPALLLSLAVACAGMCPPRWGVDLGDRLQSTFILDEAGVLREKNIGEPGIEACEWLMTTVLNKEGFYDSVY